VGVHLQCGAAGQVCSSRYTLMHMVERNARVQNSTA
jgi:hypothetical protein